MSTERFASILQSPRATTTIDKVPTVFVLVPEERMVPAVFVLVPEERKVSLLLARNLIMVRTIPVSEKALAVPSRPSTTPLLQGYNA